MFVRDSSSNLGAFNLFARLDVALSLLIQYRLDSLIQFHLLLTLQPLFVLLLIVQNSTYT